MSKKRCIQEVVLLVCNLTLLTMGLNVLGCQSHLLQRCHPACGHLRTFPSLSGSRLTIFFYRDASLTLSQLYLQYLRSHAFFYIIEYGFGCEMVCSQKSVRNRNFFENAGHVSFSFCQTDSAETHTKPCKTSPQGTSIKRPAIYWDHAVSWGGGVWVSVSDIGRAGKNMVLRRIPIYFLSTIFHDFRTTR